MLKDFFNRRQYSTVVLNEEKDKENPLKRKNKIDANTSYDKIEDSRIQARKRIENIIDKDTFIEYDLDIETINPLEFPEYDKKIQKASEDSGEKEGVITGKAEIDGNQVIICAMNPSFMMGSMGSVVREKITRAIEKAIKARLP